MTPTKKPTAAKPARKRKAPTKKPAAPKKKAAPKQAAGDATRARRLEHKRRAAEAIEKHSGPVLGMLSDVISDMAGEVEGLSQVEEDLAHCMELAHRLDKAIKLNDPILEALDGLVIFFVAAAAVGIYRSIERRSRMQGKRLDRLRKKLEDRGPLMSKLARERLEKRIARLAAK
tara:strand:- start:63 stop:584 length:522 start_codon:yes stop_codon:yes gene_type:complete